MEKKIDRSDFTSLASRKSNNKARKVEKTGPITMKGELLERDLQEVPISISQNCRNQIEEKVVKLMIKGQKMRTRS
jgi:hypothetical protein